MIDSDPTLKRIKANIAKRKPLPVKDLVNEAMRLHSQIPKVEPGAYRKIGDATLKSQADQSRVVTIKATLLRERLAMDALISELDAHLRTKYKVYLANFNRATQDASIDNALRPIVSAQRKLANAVQILDVLVDDYVSNRFSLSGAVKALEILNRADV